MTVVISIDFFYYVCKIYVSFTCKANVTLKPASPGVIMSRAKTANNEAKKTRKAPMVSITMDRAL